jgi:hypothetical protein
MGRSDDCAQRRGKSNGVSLEPNGSRARQGDCAAENQGSRDGGERKERREKQQSEAEENRCSAGHVDKSTTLDSLLHLSVM